MAINQNHLFEELNGVKCAIVEKNASQERVDFLKKLLEINGFEVVVVPSPPPKVSPPIPPKPAAAEDVSAAPANAESLPASSEAELPPAPLSFTIGVTDVVFNPTNAVFGRLLRTADGHVVTLAYWQQNENIALDDIPYFDK